MEKRILSMFRSQDSLSRIIAAFVLTIIALSFFRSEEYKYLKYVLALVITCLIFFGVCISHILVEYTIMRRIRNYVSDPTTTQEEVIRLHTGICRSGIHGNQLLRVQAIITEYYNAGYRGTTFTVESRKEAKVFNHPMSNQKAVATA